MNDHTLTTTQTGHAAPKSIDEVIESFHMVRAAVSDILVASGADPNKTRDSARLLGLNRGLAWRVSRVVRSEDIGAALSDVPTSASMDKLIRACQDRGASSELVQVARDAIDRFEGAVKRCSGDRKTLAMLMANRDERSSGIELERARRKLFEGACSVWGVQAAVRFVSVFLYPAPDDPSMLNVGHSTGYIGFRRLREIPWPLSYETVQDKEGAPRRFIKEPLDPNGSESEGMRQLIGRFCSPDDLRINVVQLGQVKRFELESGPVGNQGLTTCVFGSHLQHLFSRYASPEDDYATFYVQLETPVERVIFDMYVHEDLQVEGIPEVHLCDRLTHRHIARESDIEQESLPIGEEPFALGRGAAGAVTPHIPFYSRLVEFIGERIGHAPEEFRGSRFELKYPPISTALARRMALETAPDS